ncbi:MAG TPA: cytochrome C oxidase subunit I [Ferruginibacter sp.]|nr:cytochrome C oxidase subunit I [Ferruginibacter sp.]HRE62755.1 cytochrome C oxidase subunit I [Ferruginibacter sp.]
MFAPGQSHTAVKNTAPELVLPFYFYAALSLLAGTILLFFSADSFTQSHLHPHVLAITHIMALGWGTMIILGASHQLVPVIIEKSLYSQKLAYTSFFLAATGIPLLVYAFYTFNMAAPAKWGGRLVLLAVICYVVNLSKTIFSSRQKNVHAWFILAASGWLLFTVSLGLALVYNFSFSFLPANSFKYLPLHAHAGIIGWFLLLIIGVGARLIPMFLISKYTNSTLLWFIFGLINAGLISFTIIFLFIPGTVGFLLPIFLILIAIILFAWFCYKSFKQRIRRQVDEQMKTSLLSVWMMLLPFIFLMSIVGWLFTDMMSSRMTLVYGFIIFFGWITAIIFGMTFKTMPFIVWNTIYGQKAGIGKTPNPKDLFSNTVFKYMLFIYLVGFVLFIVGAVLAQTVLLCIAAAILILAAVLYNFNVIKLLLHKPIAK